MNSTFVEPAFKRLRAVVIKSVMAGPYVIDLELFDK
jgi:hypothetical protein